MQTSAMILGVFAALAAAQSSPFPSGFPDCGATCFNNMWDLATQLGCTGIDASCLCTKPDFAYGVRDCATESCSDNATEVIQFGADWCAAQGIAIGGFPSGSAGTVSPTTTVEATGAPITGSQSGGASEIVSTITDSDGSAISTTTIATASDSAPGSPSVTAVPVATTELLTTTTDSDGSVATSTFSTSTIFSSGPATSGTETGSPTETGTGSVTTITSESSFTSDGTTGVTSITSTSTEAATNPTGGSGESPTGGEGATDTTAAGLAAQQTAAPAGLFAAAGLAFLML
ncbi:hypothetical protein F4809DRAFT_619918 [Biscogniauxia mediterranea]|nr:hypothetical protein F4809DRAFT_619918 [Biscogniauxia mediterranea]